MSKQKLHLHAKVFDATEDKDLIEIVRSRGIQVPSTHLAFFKSVYAKLEEANRNGVRLSTEAVESALPGLVGAQVNLEHLGEGFMVGSILDAWINANNQIEIAFTFAKSIYVEKFEQAKEKLATGELSVSFELLADRASQEFLSDGTVRLNDIDFQGVGLLLENPPAEPTAKVFEMAKVYKQRVSDCSEKELICASQILESCNKVLGEDITGNFLMNIQIRTSMNDGHSHFAIIDADGNGSTEGTFGPDDEKHSHPIVNFEIKEIQDHNHILLKEALDLLKKAFKSTDGLSKETKPKHENGGNKLMSEEQKELVAKIREELGNFAIDFSDEDLLDDSKVSELRQIKADAEEKPAEDPKDEEDPKTEEPKTEETEEAKEEEPTREELEAKIAELQATIEAKDSEIEAVRNDAEKIGKLKVELKDNPYVAEFSAEDYLDETKVEIAKTKHELDKANAKVEELSKVKEAKTEEKETPKEEAKTEEKVEASEKENLDQGEGKDDTLTAAQILHKNYNRKK